MAMFLTRDPMTRRQFDQALTGIGWRSRGEEAYDAAAPAKRHIRDIDKVPSADGTQRIMFNTRVDGCGRLFAAVDCVGEGDPLFWDTLGIHIEQDAAPLHA